MREGVRCNFGVFCLDTAAFIMVWYAIQTRRKNSVLTDDTIEVVVNLNIIVKKAELLLISIYISNQRRRISGVAFQLDVLHHLSLIVKIS
jgi:hypothetical protein